MSYFYFLALASTLLFGSCGDQATPSNGTAVSTTTEQPTTAAEPTATAQPTRAAEPASDVVDSPSEGDPHMEERKKINAEVDRINNNIGDYSKKQYDIDHEGNAYKVTQYFDNNGVMIKSEAISDANYWRFYFVPLNKMDNQMIYATYYEKTDNPYTPITREYFGIGSMIEGQERFIFTVDDIGNAMKGKELMDAEQSQEDAMIAFTAYR